MGFFTIPIARMIGPSGRVVAADIQARMLSGLRRRAAKAGLQSRIETRLATLDSLEVQDLHGKVDLVLAFAVVHEMPSPEAFFQQTVAALKPGGQVFFVEPAGHVNQKKFAEETEAAWSAGLEEVSHPLVRHNHAVLLQKKVA